jgi:hypothetical protein
VWEIGVVAGLVVIVLVIAAWRASLAARTRIWLDPQYREGKHVARRSAGRHAAEGPTADVPGLVVHRRAVHIRRLGASTARRYQEEWPGLEARFDRDPEGAVLDADRLITMVMLDRGFPVDDLEQRAPELHARHGRTVDTYREAHAVALAVETAAPTREQLQKALARYADLFGALVPGAVAERRRAG